VSKKPRKRRHKNKNKSKDFRKAIKDAEKLSFDPRVLDDPRVQEVLAKMQTAPDNSTMLEYHLLLERILLQDQSMLDNPERSEELSRTRASAYDRDKAEEAFERDEAGFLADVWNRSENIKLTGAAADRAKAQAVKMLDEARKGKRAEYINKQLQLDWMIEHGPKTDVMGQGHWVEVGSRPNSRRIIKSDVVRIMHRQWVIQPGVNHDVPEIFAKRYEILLRSRQEQADREKAMGADMEAGQLEGALQKIDKVYGTSRQKLTGAA